MLKYALLLVALQGCAVTDCRPGISPSDLSGMTNADLAAWQTLAMFGPLIKCKVQ